jgi:hypothetical protein
VRGIQLVSVSPSGAAAESDDIVKDLETWFENHQQMCRLISTTPASDAGEVESNLDRLKASVDSGHRLFSLLKNSYQKGRGSQPQVHRSSCSIPLSGMNRFDESRGHAASAAGANQVAQNMRPAPSPNVSFGPVQGLQPVSASEQPLVLPSRTYLKKSGG